MPDTMSARQAAAACGISDRTLRRWIRSGRLDAERDGDDFAITREALAAAISNAVAAAPPAPALPHAAADPTNGVPHAAATVAAGDLQGAALVALVDKLTQQNLEMAGRIGYYQAELEQARTRLAALEAPRGEPETGRDATGLPVAPPADPAPRRWWQRILFG